MSKMNTLMFAACGIALAVLAPLGSGADPDGQSCRHRYLVDPQSTGGLTGVPDLSNGAAARQPRGEPLLCGKCP
jgi:hypothetical protein